MAEEKLKPEQLAQIELTPPSQDWMDPHVDFRKGTWNYAAVPSTLDYLDLPNAGKWSPPDEEWPLPDNWQEIIFKGMKDRLNKYRTFRVFMDICLRG